MAIRVQNLPKKFFDGSSLHSLSHLSVSGPPWWNSSEQQIAKHLDLHLPDQESTSAQAIGQSHCEVGVIGVTNSQCNSSESGTDASGSVIYWEFSALYFFPFSFHHCSC